MSFIAPAGFTFSPRPWPRKTFLDQSPSIGLPDDPQMRNTRMLSRRRSSLIVHHADDAVSLPFSTRSPRSLSPRISPISLLFRSCSPILRPRRLRVSLFVLSLPPAANAIVSFEKRRSLHASLRRNDVKEPPVHRLSVSSFGNSFDSLGTKRERDRQLSRTRRLIDRFYGLFRSWVEVVRLRSNGVTAMPVRFELELRRSVSWEWKVDSRRFVDRGEQIFSWRLRISEKKFTGAAKWKQEILRELCL